MSKTSFTSTEEEIVSENKADSEIDYRRTEFLGAIVSASTFAPPGDEIDTNLRCRKRPERKQCHGLIRVQLQEEPVELRWWCPVCGDGGVIHNWKGIPWKRTHLKTAHGKKDNAYCEVILTLKDFDLLKEISILDPEAESVVHNAITTNDGILLMGKIKCIDTLIGYIAFEANHEQKPRRQQMLNKLFDKICSILSTKW